MTCSYLARPRPLVERSRAFRLLVEYNPFYLLSAIFMLGGLFALNDSLDWSPLPVGNILILIATLNLYEMLLIGMAVYLLQRGVRRDATMLLIIEAFFLVDAGFLNAEIFTQDLAIGLVVNGILAGLAALKLAIVFRALHLPVNSGAYLLIMLQVIVLSLMPGVFKYVALGGNGALPATVMYAFWWVVGGIVALYGILMGRIDFSNTTPRIDPFGRNRAIVAAFLMLGLISILAHLCTSNWVYNVRWYTANLAPVLLGLAVALGSLEGTVLRYRKRMRAELALPMAAIVISAPFPSALAIAPGQLAELTPLRLALLASALVYVHGWARFQQAVFAWMGTSCLLLAGLGSSVGAIIESVMIFNRAAADVGSALTPKRTVHWGVLSVAFSFVLLLAGLALSMKKNEETDDSRATS